MGDSRSLSFGMKGWGLTPSSSGQTGDEHPSMNRLTDALYMVRFKVRPAGLLFLSGAASW